jgi:hypothetical protein
MDRGNNWLRAGAHGFDEIAGKLRECQQTGHFELGEWPDDFVDVAAGTKIIAGSGYNYGFDVGGIGKRTKKIAQFGVRLERQRILALRPVQRNDCRRVFYFKFEMVS